MPTPATIDLIGVAFDGWGRSGAQARAASALREAGLAEAFAGEVCVQPDVTYAAPAPARAAGSGLMNEAALLDMLEDVHRRVGNALASGPGRERRPPHRATRPRARTVPPCAEPRVGLSRARKVQPCGRNRTIGSSRVVRSR